MGFKLVAEKEGRMVGGVGRMIGVEEEGFLSVEWRAGWGGGEGGVKFFPTAMEEE